MVYREVPLWKQHPGIVKRFTRPLVFLLVFKPWCLFKDHCVDAQRNSEWSLLVRASVDWTYCLPGSDRSTIAIG